MEKFSHTCNIQCDRQFCENNDCLSTYDIPEINQIIFDEYVNILRQHSHRGQLATDLYFLTKKYDNLIKEELAMIEFIKEFDIRGARTFTLDGIEIK